LDLASKWNFKSVRALAIKQLGPIALPIDKIVVGRKHQIDEWLGDAYRSVCMRPDPLTLEEGIRLGMDDVIKISAIRHEYDLGMKGLPVLLLGEKLQKQFGLDSRVRSTDLETRNDRDAEFVEHREQNAVEAQREERVNQVPECPTDNYDVLNRYLMTSNGPYDDLGGHEIMEARRVEVSDRLDPSLKPLTKKAQLRIKRHQEKEAREKAERELQEQLERELGDDSMRSNEFE